MRKHGWTAFCALMGATFALIAPPTGWVPVVWVGLGGLGYALDVPLPGARRWFEGGGRGLAFGFGANVVMLRFIPEVIARFTPLPFAAGVVLLVLLALAQGITWAGAGMARSALVRVGVPRPIAFALGVYASTFVPSIFPWTPAVGLTPRVALVQLAELAGERGVSALVVLSAGLLACGVRALVERRGGARGVLGLAIAIPLTMAIQGVARMQEIDARRSQAPNASIGLVDALIPATTRWDPSAATSILASLSKQTELAELHGAEVTVWPESAYPYVLPRGSKDGPPGPQRPIQHSVRGPLLIGLITQDAQGDHYNAAVAVHADGVLASEYDKLHLLWFGEEVPFATELPWLRRTFARGLGLLPGDRPEVLDLGRVKAAALICFEDTLPGAGREAVSVSPNLLVNLSNDAWFVGSQEPEMHLRASVMRAVETRRDLVRAVNVGPTSFIDAAGRTLADYEAGIPSSLVVKVALLEGPPTIYARFGDAPWIVAFAAMVAIFAVTKANGRRSTKDATPGR